MNAKSNIKKLSAPQSEWTKSDSQFTFIQSMYFCAMFIAFIYAFPQETFILLQANIIVLDANTIVLWVNVKFYRGMQSFYKQAWCFTMDAIDLQASKKLYEQTWSFTGKSSIVLQRKPVYIYAFSRRFYPKRLTVHSGYTLLISMCVSWELNPQPLRCWRNVPQEHSFMSKYDVSPISYLVSSPCPLRGSVLVCRQLTMFGNRATDATSRTSYSGELLKCTGRVWGRVMYGESREPHPQILLKRDHLIHLIHIIHIIAHGYNHKDHLQAG